MNLKRTILFLFCIAVIGVSCVVVYYFGWHIADYQEVDVYYRVVSPGSGGLLINNSLLHFGYIPAGSSAFRSINITVAQPYSVRMGFTGNASEYLYFRDDLPAYMVPDVIYTIRLGVNVADSAEFGDREGKLRVQFFRP